MGDVDPSIRTYSVGSTLLPYRQKTTPYPHVLFERNEVESRATLVGNFSTSFHSARRIFIYLVKKQKSRLLKVAGSLLWFVVRLLYSDTNQSSARLCKDEDETEEHKANQRGSNHWTDSSKEIKPLSSSL